MFQAEDWGVMREADMLVRERWSWSLWGVVGSFSCLAVWLCWFSERSYERFVASKLKESPRLVRLAMSLR